MKTRLTTHLLLLALLLPALAGTATAQASQPTTAPTVTASADAAPPLSDAQKQAMQRIQAASEKQAAPVAQRLAGIVRQVYENMLADRPNPTLRARLSAQMKDAAWELLTIKGQSIRETVNVLTPRQKQFLRAALRKPGASADLTETLRQTFNTGVKPAQ